VRIFRFAGILVVLVLAMFTYPGASAVSIIAGLNPAAVPSAPGPAGTLPWLHIEHPADGRAYIADDQGRLVIFHGAVPASLLDFGNNAQPDAAPVYPIDRAAYASRCPPAVPGNRYPPLCRQDLEQMAAFGFNSVRLPLSWSLLEPQRGQFSQTYLDRLAQVVDWARSLGMYVIIDMHQNAYSRYVGPGPNVDLTYDSGAPKWATYTDGFPSRVFDSQRELNPTVFEAATNFWYDRGGIQDEYIAAVAFLARRFKDDSTVAGYGVFNEPWPGWNLPPGFEDLLLFPFYRRVIDAITGARDGLPCWTGFYMPAPCGYPDLGVHDLRHLFFLEPGLLRQITDFPTHLGLPVSSYPNLVLDLHTYTHGFTLDSLVLKQDPYHATYPWGGYDQTYDLGLREAKTINAALFVAEFGDDPRYDTLLLANETREQDKYRVGFAFWTWKENGGSGSWGMFNSTSAGSATASSGCLRAERERLLARVYPRASADTQLVYRYDPATGAFKLSARGGAGEAPTMIAIPHEVTGPVSSTGAVHVSSAAAAGGGRLVTASPSGGIYTITVAAAQLSLTGC
jgi:endoglycosylceramidase